MILIRAGLILTALLIFLLLFMLKSCGKTAVPEPVEGTEPLEGPTTVPELVEGTEPVKGTTTVPEPVEGTEPVIGPGSAAPTTSARELTTDAATAPATQPPATKASPPVPVTTSATTPAAPTTAHSHSYSAWVSKEATCTEQGVKTYRCSCGSSYTEAIPALGHTWHEESVLLKAAWDEKVKVKDAWDEKVKVKDAWDEKVKVKDAWDETVVVKAAWDETVLVKDATSAWDEQVLVREAWTEEVKEWHSICDCGFDLTAYGKDNGLKWQDFYDEHMDAHERNFFVDKIDDKTMLTNLYGQAVVDKYWDINRNYTVDSINDGSMNEADAFVWGIDLRKTSVPGQWRDMMVFVGIVEHPAQYITVHHEAIPAQYKTVHHEAETKTVHHEAEYKTVHHEAEYKTVHHEAEYKTVHHDAEYGKQSTCTRCGMKK